MVKTIVVNAVTREIINYSIDETPKWVDRMQPENIIKEWGKYKLGFWNTA